MVNEKMKITDISIVKKALEISLTLLKSKLENFNNVNEIKEAFISSIKKAEMKN